MKTIRLDDSNFAIMKPKGDSYLFKNNYLVSDKGVKNYKSFTGKCLSVLGIAVKVENSDKSVVYIKKKDLKKLLEDYVQPQQLKHFNASNIERMIKNVANRTVSDVIETLEVKEPVRPKPDLVGMKLLEAAIQAQDTKAIDSLLGEKWEIRPSKDNLFEAVIMGDVAIFQKLEAKRPIEGFTHENGNSLLLQALLSGKLDLAEYLIREKSDTGLIDQARMGDPIATPLVIAYKNGFSKIVSSLTDKGAMLSASQAFYLIHPDNSTSKAFNHILKREEGGDIAQNYTNELGENAVAYLAHALNPLGETNGNNFDITKRIHALLQKGGNLEGVNETTLFKIINHSAKEDLDLLLQKMVELPGSFDDKKNCLRTLLIKMQNEELMISLELRDEVMSILPERDQIEFRLLLSYIHEQ